MPSVKSLTLAYETLNAQGTFSEGDAVVGTVTLSVEKNITVQRLYVKIKGDANVHWTQRVGDHSTKYSAHRRYFKLKQILIGDNAKDSAVPKGVHVYNFSFNIPPGNVPGSFRGNHGKIVYKLEAVLSRSWRMNWTEEKEILVVSKFFPNLHSLMVGSTNKEMGVFSKGHAHMDVIVDKRAYAPGEIIIIVAKINNSSSKDMTPKFSLIQEVVYRANGHTKEEVLNVLKGVGNCIKPQTQMEVKCEFMIPPNQVQSIQNCDILSLEYHVKVYLDISFSFDPEVILPVTILPPNLVQGYPPGVPTGPHPAGGFGTPSNSDFPPPGAFAGPYPPVGIVGPVNSNFPPPGAPKGPYPAVGIGGPVNSNVPSTGPPMGPYPPVGIGGPGNSNFPPPGAPSGPYPAVGIEGPVNSNFPPPGPPMGPYPAGGFGGPVNSNIPAPGVSGGPYPTSPNLGNVGHPGAQSYPAPPAPCTDKPLAYSGPPAVCPSPLSTSSSSPVLDPPPSAPTFPSPLSNSSPFPAPAYDPLPSITAMNTDFLSQTDEAPPAYSLLSLSSDTKKSETKE